MKQEIRFVDIHQLERVLDCIVSDVDEFTITIEKGGDICVETSSCEHGVVEHRLADKRRATPEHPAHPPSWAEYLLLLIPVEHREHLIGDLEEEFRTIVLPRHGPRRAYWWYWAQTVASLLPFLVQFLKRAFWFATLLKLIGG